MLRSDATDPGPVSQIDDRHDYDRSEQQSPVHQRQNEQCPDQLHDRAPRIVDEPKNQIANALGILPYDAGRSAGLEFLHAMQRQPDRMLEDSFSNGHSNQHRDPRRMPAAPDLNSHLEKRKQKHNRRDAKQQVMPIPRDPVRHVVR